MKSIQLFAATVLAATNVLGQTGTKPSQTSKGVQVPASEPTLNVPTVQGCFSDPGLLKFDSTPKFNSVSSCVLEICKVGGFEVAGTTGGNQCWCGTKYPANSTLVEDSKCNIGCSGYDLEACKLCPRAARVFDLS